VPRRRAHQAANFTQLAKRLCTIIAKLKQLRVKRECCIIWLRPNISPKKPDVNTLIILYLKIKALHMQGFFVHWHTKLFTMSNNVRDKMTNAESIVADFLKEIDIWWEFERPVFVLDEAKRPRVWSPDYYLPELGIYVEVASSGNEKSYQYRQTIYIQNKIPIIFVNPYDRSDWRKLLIDGITEIHQHRYSLIKGLKVPKTSNSVNFFKR
jgi:hypothetical protein